MGIIQRQCYKNTFHLVFTLIKIKIILEIIKKEIYEKITSKYKKI